MKISDIIKRSNKNLLRSKVRTTLTILAIFIGAFTLTLTLGIGQGAQQFINNQTSTIKVSNTLEIYKPYSDGGSASSGTPKKYDSNKNIETRNFYLTDKDITTIKNTKGIESVQPLYSLTPKYITREGEDKYVIAIQGLIKNADFKLEAGNLPSSSDKNYIIIPDGYVKALGFSSPDNSIGKDISVTYSDTLGTEKTLTYKIKGVLVNSVFVAGNASINNDEASALYKFQNSNSALANSYISAYAQYSSTASKSDIDNIKNELSKKSLTAQTFEDLISKIQSTINIVQIVLSFFAFIAILASTFGIANTLIMSIYERKSEIGLMKALGMSRFSLFKIFAIEATSIGFWGGIIGSGIAILIGRIANHILSTTYLKDFYNYELLVFTPIYVILVILFLMIIGFLAGTIPAIRASRLNPITALREE